MTRHLTTEELAAGLAVIEAAPADGGGVEMILARPGPDKRMELESARLSAAEGLEGDSWSSRPSPKPDMQLTLMSSRAIGLIAGGRQNWAAAGDNLFVDIDMSPENLPPGTRLALGGAEIEITAAPHTGCDNFIDRFGRAACVFVNTGRGKALRMRGLNPQVIRDGTVSRGDRVRKLP